MTHYENERSLPVYTRPFAKRRMIRATTATMENDYRHCNCTVCANVKAIEGVDQLDWNQVHGVLYSFTRKWLDYSKEQDLQDTYIDNRKYWTFVAQELQQGLIKLD